jgi:amino acid transporter
MSQHKKFGTFLGVYTPSVLTILGLIMYLRFGWVVGNLGLGLTLLVVVMSCAITFITGLSASAIATNIQVGVGGEYFLVSRSLGIEPGAAIGIPLYLCRTLSVTFYSFGLAEALLLLWPVDWGILPGWSTQALAAFFIILVALLSGKSAGLVLKMQIPIMILVALSVLALIFGVFTNELKVPEWTPSYRTAPEGFWYIFAVFFPAVTGFAAGIGMSGDLKNPRKSIPEGTMGAVWTGFAVYILIPVVLAVSAILSLEELASRDAGLAVWTTIAIGGALLIYPAVWGAILSSAFGSMLGAPRVLQALSMDGLAPKFLSRLSKTGQPTVATWISGVLALLAVLLGELNTVAQFASVLFLTLYVAINISAAIEKLVAEPSYRPKIRVPWYVSMAGAIAAIMVMYLINPLACFFAFLLEIGILVYMKRKALEQQWGDVAAGFWTSISRFALLQLGERKIHPRNWRPYILLFVKDIKDRKQLVMLAGWFGQNRGILNISRMMAKGRGYHKLQKAEIIREMHRDLQDLGMQAFCEVNVVKDIYQGILNVSKGHGLGGMKTNTIMFGWSEEKAGQQVQLESIRDLALSGKNILLTRFGQPEVFKNKKRIDLWWGGKEVNGDLMLLCAHLLRLNSEWTQAKVMIHSVVNSLPEKQILEDGIAKLLPIARIVAQINILVNREKEAFTTILKRESQDADIVFLGLLRIDDENIEIAAESIAKLSEGLDSVVFVQNNSVPGTVPILLQLD